MTHHRCYRSKATDRYLMLTKRGVELLDLKDGEHMRNDWLRAMCHYGFLPCNGLLYVPPHHCFCYPGVKMTGMVPDGISAFCAPSSKNRTVFSACSRGSISRQQQDRPGNPTHGPHQAGSIA